MQNKYVWPSSVVLFLGLLYLFLQLDINWGWAIVLAAFLHIWVAAWTLVFEGGDIPKTVTLPSKRRDFKDREGGYDEEANN